MQQTGKSFVLSALDPVNKIGFESLSHTITLCTRVCLNGHGGLFEVSNVVRLTVCMSRLVGICIGMHGQTVTCQTTGVSFDH